MNGAADMERHTCTRRRLENRVIRKGMFARTRATSIRLGTEGSSLVRAPRRGFTRRSRTLHTSSCPHPAQPYPGLFVTPATVAERFSEIDLTRKRSVRQTDLAWYSSSGCNFTTQRAKKQEVPRASIRFQLRRLKTTSRRRENTPRTPGLTQDLQPQSGNQATRWLGITDNSIPSEPDQWDGIDS